MVLFIYKEKKIAAIVEGGNEKRQLSIQLYIFNHKKVQTQSC